jgi:hypothetical protein
MIFRKGLFEFYNGLCRIMRDCNLNMVMDKVIEFRNLYEFNISKYIKLIENGDGPSISCKPTSMVKSPR